MVVETISIINDKLELQWSPEQISGWMKKQGYTNTVSYETIYQYVWKNKKRKGSLYKNLRHHGKKYNKRSKGKAGRGCIPDRIGIEERPDEVEQKIRLGDWEADTVVGTKHSGCIVSLVDRASKVTKLKLVNRRTALEVTEAIIESLDPIKEFVLTLTADNGKEFAAHKEVSKALGADFYFARPYHSWERGLNEHTNGLIRQYLPKKKRFDEISPEDLMRIEDLLNNRPRKILNFSTPLEVFNRLSQKS